MDDGFILPPEHQDEGKDRETRPLRAPYDRRFGFWGRLPLARKLLLAFGILFVFVLVVAILTLNGLSQTQTAYENAIKQGIEIRRISDQLGASLLQARANEKNFLLRWRDEGYFTASKNYVEPYTQNLADMREQIERLSAFTPKVANTSTDPALAVQYASDIASLSINVDNYEKSFRALVVAYQKKGFDDENTDIESRFRLAARKMEEKFFGRTSTDTELEKLQSLFSRIRLNEKDYLLSTDLNYINAMQILSPELKGQIRLSNELNPQEKTELLSQLDEYLSAINDLKDLDQQINGYERELVSASASVEQLTTNIKKMGEELASGDIAQARSNSTRTFTISMLAILVTLVLSVMLAFNFSQQLTRPLILLTKIAQEIAEGNFHMYAEVRSADEVGILTQAINEMTVQLRSALQNLENRAKKLKEQTTQLEFSSRQRDKRAQQLQTIAEIARYILKEKDLNKLLPLVTQTVSKEFGFYHVGIFLLEQSGKFAVLLAANSAGGQKMLQRKHSLEVGQTGIVGNVTATGVPRIALDTDKDVVYFNNPDLPETRSELALPLKIEEQVIGALDIQSTEVNAFSEEDIEALTVLANQVSIAIENARLFNQIEKSLTEAGAIQRQYIRQTWERLPKEEKFIGYRYSITGAVPLTPEEVEATGNAQHRRHEVSVPIILRGETIGTLNVQSPVNERVTQDQMDLIRAVAERVAISAENARLFDETTRRAESERIVSDIASKISASFQTESILRTTASELSHLLGDADILINLKSTNNDNKETK